MSNHTPYLRWFRFNSRKMYSFISSFGIMSGGLLREQGHVTIYVIGQDSISVELEV